VVPGNPEPVTTADPLEPSSSAGIAGSSVLVLAFLLLVGLAWSWTGIDEVVGAVAIAPAAGAAALVLAGILLERLGVAIDDAAGAWVASALAGGSGVAVRLVLQRRAARGPASQVEQ
jgi:hypothetical protein